MHRAPLRNKELLDWRGAALGRRQSRRAVWRGAGSERAPVGGAGALVPVLSPRFFPSLFPCSARRRPPRPAGHGGAELSCESAQGRFCDGTALLGRGTGRAGKGREGAACAAEIPPAARSSPGLLLPGACGAESPPTAGPGSGVPGPGPRRAEASGAWGGLAAELWGFLARAAPTRAQSGGESDGGTGVWCLGQALVSKQREETGAGIWLAALPDS